MSSGNSDGPRLVVSSDDHRAILVIVIVIGVLWSIMVIGARLIWRFHQKSELGLDDVVALLATIVSVVQASVTLGGVHDGLGKAVALVNPDQITQAGQYLYSSSILYILALCASKASVPLLIVRLTRDPRQVLCTYIILGITLLWGLASTFAVAFSCGIPVSWQAEATSTCSDMFSAWVTIESIGLLIEVLIIAMTIALVQNLNMLLKFKIAVVGSFSLRIFLIVPVAFRLIYVHDVQTAADPFFANVDVVVATQVVLHYSLWAASFPCMRAFLRAFDTGLGVTTGVPTHKGSNYQNDSRSMSFAMKSLTREQQGQQRASVTPRTTIVTNASSPTSEPDSIEKIETYVDNSGRHNKHLQRPSDEESESSQRAIISRTVEWKITYEDAPGVAM